MQILLEDDDLLVINKPAGKITNQAESVRTKALQTWFAENYEPTDDWQGMVPPDFDDRYGSPEEIYHERKGMVHRLDKNTSGVLVFAKNPGALVMLLTHGFTRTTYVALGGTILAIFATGILAHVAIVVTRLSGFFSEEAIYLNLNTGGTLDMQGLFLGAVIIGVLGLLDDVAITQVHTVAELRKSGASGAQAFTRALRVGREHVSALVNTLALAYTGAALPVLLLFSLSEQSALLLVNREIFAAEIIRTTVGSIGLILTVPLTTWLAVWFKVGDSDRHESTT